MAARGLAYLTFEGVAVRHSEGSQRYRLTVYRHDHARPPRSTMLYAHDLDDACAKAREWLAVFRLTKSDGLEWDRWTLMRYISPYQLPKIVATGTHLRTTWMDPKLSMR